MLDFLGSAIGGILGFGSQKKAIKAQENMAQKNIDLQREFASNGIQWKVADAKAAGIHPLAALGAQTTSFSPVSIDSSVYAANPLGEAASAMGQDLSRAVDATRSKGQKVDAYTKTVQDLSLQRMGLENQLLSSQIAKTNATGPTPPMPTAQSRWLMDGQGQTALPASPTIPVQRGPLLSDKPLERTVSDPNAPFMEPGAINDLGFARTPTGYAPVPSSDVKQRIDDDFIGSAMWHVRNRIPQSFGFNNTPPFKAPAGKFWMFNPFKQEYQLYKKGVHNPWSSEHNR